jgi:hypothetical protein
MEYSLLKVTVFSPGSNVVDAPAPDTNGFLLRNICVSSGHLNRTIWNKDSVPPHWKSKLQEELLPETS